MSDDRRDDRPDIFGLGDAEPGSEPESVGELFKTEGSPEQLGALYAALAKAQGEFERAVTDTEGRDGNRTFRYADMASLRRAAGPALSRNGIALMQFPLGSGGTLLTIVAGHGATIQTTMHFHRPEFRSISAIKLFGSELTYLSRYAVRSILWLPGDDDLDNGQPQDAPRSRQAPQPPKRSPADSQGHGNGRPEHAPESTTVVGQQGSDEQAGSAVKLSPARPAGVVNDVNGPDGEAVPDDHPEFRDNGPIQDVTKTLLSRTVCKLLSASGKPTDVPPGLKGIAFRAATGQDMQKGVLPTEGQAQRLIHWLYTLARERGVNPDSPVNLTRDEIEVMQTSIGRMMP